MTLIINPSDPSTLFLKPIYNDIVDKKVITGNLTKDELKNEIINHDEIIICGHGNGSNGLFAINQFKNLGYMDYIVDKSFAPLLKQKNKKIIAIWCYAKNYIETNDINNSFHCGMFISEVAESIYCGLKDITQEQIEESNYCFSIELGSIISKTPIEIFNSMSVGQYSKLAKYNPVAKYNFQRLHYDYKKNYLA